MTSSPILYSQVYLSPGGINIIKDKNGKDLRVAEGIRKWWQDFREELYKKDLNDLDHSPRARHPGMQSQVGLRNHHYEQSYWR